MDPCSTPGWWGLGAPRISSAQRSKHQGSTALVSYSLGFECPGIIYTRVLGAQSHIHQGYSAPGSYTLGYQGTKSMVFQSPSVILSQNKGRASKLFPIETVAESFFSNCLSFLVSKMYIKTLSVSFLRHINNIVPDYNITNLTMAPQRGNYQDI